MTDALIQLAKTIHSNLNDEQREALAYARTTRNRSSDNRALNGLRQDGMLVRSHRPIPIMDFCFVYTRTPLGEFIDWASRQ